MTATDPYAPPTTEAVAALKWALFLNPDDLTLRSVLADAYGDAGVETRREAERLVADDVREAAGFRFFLGQRGGPKYAAGGAESARRLAAAERWLKDAGGNVEWEEDDEPTSCDCGHPDCEPHTAWRVAVTLPCRGCGERTHLGYRCCGLYPEGESCGGVDFGPDGYPDSDPYARVLAAELASELMTHHNES